MIFDPDMFPEEREIKLVKISGKDNNYSDIPPLDKSFALRKKKVKKKGRTEAISIRIDTEILKWFRNQANNNPDVRGYQTLINDVLRTYVMHQVKIEEKSR